MSKPDITTEIIIQCAPASIRRALDELNKAEPIMVQPSGDWPAYVIDSEAFDNARDEIRKLLNDLQDSQ